MGFLIYVFDDWVSIVDKIDVIVIFGGDGIVLCVVSLFKFYGLVLFIFFFSMGIFGFLGEWNFGEYKKVWWEVYMSGSDVVMWEVVVLRGVWDEVYMGFFVGWERMRGKSLGVNRVFKILLWYCIKVDIFDFEGNNINY